MIVPPSIRKLADLHRGSGLKATLSRIFRRKAQRRLAVALNLGEKASRRASQITWFSAGTAWSLASSLKDKEGRRFRQSNENGYLS